MPRSFFFLPLLCSIFSACASPDESVGMARSLLGHEDPTQLERDLQQFPDFQLRITDQQALPETIRDELASLIARCVRRSQRSLHVTNRIKFTSVSECDEVVFRNEIDAQRITAAIFLQNRWLHVIGWNYTDDLSVELRDVGIYELSGERVGLIIHRLGEDRDLGATLAAMAETVIVAPTPAH